MVKAFFEIIMDILRGLFQVTLGFTALAMFSTIFFGLLFLIKVLIVEITGHDYIADYAEWLDEEVHGKR